MKKILKIFCTFNHYNMNMTNVKHRPKTFKCQIPTYLLITLQSNTCNTFGQALSLKHIDYVYIR
jgi:hypothetical protein